MSYCRYGTDKGKSDVYIYGTFNKNREIRFEICLSWKKAKELCMPQIIICKTRAELLERMIYCKKVLKLHVPRCAFRRLRKEFFFEKYGHTFLVRLLIKLKEKRIERILNKL